MRLLSNSTPGNLTHGDPADPARDLCPSLSALVIRGPRGWQAALATVTNSTQLFSDCRTCWETQSVLQHQLSLLASRAAAFGAYRACFGTPPTHALTA